MHTLPAPEDLVELRSAGHDRMTAALKRFEHVFKLVDQRHIAIAADLDVTAVRDVLLSMYRPIKSQNAIAIAVTFSLDLLLFRAV